MKKFLSVFCMLLYVMGLHAQATVNQDGTLKFRGNVAIFVNFKSYTLRDGKAEKRVDVETATLLKNTLRAFAMEKFQNIAFGIVNRNDEANRQVEALIEENKLEDYLDGISVKAKNQGADYLYFVDATLYAENEQAAQIEVATRLLNVGNNLGYHFFFRSEPLSLNDIEGSRKEISRVVKYFSSSLETSLNCLFPEQYFIARADGKVLTLGAYQPNGRIMPTDKFYAFRYKKDVTQLNGVSVPIQVLERICFCQKPAMANGQFTVRADKSISPASDIILFRNVAQPIFSGTNQLTVTAFGLASNGTSLDDLTKSRINNALYAAITRHPGLQLIEHDHLASLKQERELQKGEDFVDGHVVEQMKAIGAMYLLHLDGYQRAGATVSMKLSLIDVGKNQVVRTVDVVSSLDNIENELYKQLCQRIAFPCLVKREGKSQIELTSVLSLTSGDDCVLELTKPVQNPATGEVTYSRSDVCTLHFDTYMGNKSLLTIGKVFSEDDLADIESASAAGRVTFRINGSEILSGTSAQTDVQQKAEQEEKKQKRKDTLKKFRKSLIENTRVRIRRN